MTDQIDIPEFGIKRDNEERRDGGLAIVFDPETKKYAVGLQQNGFFRLFSGGVDADEDIEQGTLREVVEESGLHNFSYVENIGEAMTHYLNTLRNVSRVARATCFLVILKDRDTVDVKLEEHETFTLTWATADEILNNWEKANSNHDVDHWIYFLNKAIKRLKELNY